MKLHKWRDISARTREQPGMTERIERARQQIDADFAALSDVRKARQFTQVQLAKALGVSQSGVSRIENEADLYVSTLRSYVEAMGGRLVITAEFPDATIEIGDLTDLRDDDSPEAESAEDLTPPATARR